MQSEGNEGRKEEGRKEGRKDERKGMRECERNKRKAIIFKIKYAIFQFLTYKLTCVKS